MSSKPSDDSLESKTGSSQTMESNEELLLRTISAAEKSTAASNLAAQRMASPWKGWSFLYKIMFILGIVLLLVLSCLIPIVLLQQVTSNNKQDDTIASLLNTTVKDDNEIIANQEKILKNQAIQISNLQKVIDNQVLLSANQAAVCAVLPACKFSTSQPINSSHP